MNKENVSALLTQTLDPNQQKGAEAQLGQMQKIIGFPLTLLEIVMDAHYNLATRQSGVILLKRLITNSWSEKSYKPTEGVAPFAIHEQDRACIRQHLVQAMIGAPEALRIQLGVCVSTVIKSDFPGRWSEVVDQINLNIASGSVETVYGALLVEYQLVKAYEYKKREDRVPLNEAMNLLLPPTFELLNKCMGDMSGPATEVRKLILKIFFALTQYLLPLELLPRETLKVWLERVRQILLLPIPDATQAVDEDERPQLIWWKEKKWAMHILTRFFERYGSPGNVQAEYKEFSEYFIKEFSEETLKSIFQVLEYHLTGTYVSPRVIQQALNYLNTGVSHSLTWKFIKPHAPRLIEGIIFPLMSYSQEDAELWDQDPYEYIRIKFDIFEDFVSPVTAAQTLLHSMCKKRKNVLNVTMDFLMTVVRDPRATASQKDGALHMIGTMADILLKQKMYKEKLEDFLTQVIFPEFNNPLGHLRARACWMLHYFSDIRYKNPAVLGEAFRLTIYSLLNDKDIPVKVEAAIALQMMLTSQGDVAKAFLEPQIGQITLELLNIIRDTENDDLTSVMQKIICSYSEQLTPLATNISQHLVDTFIKVVTEGSDDGDDKAITAMGLLNTLETLYSVMEANETVRTQLEPILLKVIHHIFSNSIMEFYEEALTLSCDMTSATISPNMWSVLELIYQAFQRDAIDYFTDMLPVLHNFITTDTNAFLSKSEYLMAMYNMSKTVLENDSGEDPQCHAAKLLEVIVLQCTGRNIDQAIPLFVQLALARLGQEIKTSELRTMCLQVIIAALLYNQQVFMNSIQASASTHPPEVILKNFLHQWLSDADCFIGVHDRKLSILGLCTLLNMPEMPGVAENAQRYLPALVMLFDGLKRAYELQDDSDDNDSNSEASSWGDEEALESDEDEIDETSKMYLESLSEKLVKSPGGQFQVQASVENGEDWDSDDDFYEEPSLENYTTPIDDEDAVDEYLIFKTTLETVEKVDPKWYAQVVAPLNEDMKQQVQSILTTHEQRKAAKESKSIEKQGGYMFDQQAVPSQFSFGS
eukprot:maker-scaffold96_size378025-snap-gene-2.39 protein:Tk04972 transcript:maker-scaffold96_size378025-snap-gene-2.39-mRNA-1 annotation:"Importin-7"